jgi:hypothetical protein
LRFNARRMNFAWLNSVQPRDIPVDRDHSGPAIGRVLHIERHEADQGNVWLVAEVELADWQAKLPERSRYGIAQALRQTLARSR